MEDPTAKAISHSEKRAADMSTSTAQEPGLAWTGHQSQAISLTPLAWHFLHTS